VSNPYVIVGGGLSGLAMAVALRRRGAGVIVLERRAAPPVEGAGIQIGPNGSHMLRRLGVFDAVAATAVEQQAISVRRAGRPTPLASLPLGLWLRNRHGAPYLTALRAQVQQVLLDAARSAGADIRFGIDVARVTQRADAAAVMTSTGVAIEAAGIIGADGVWSRVRTLVFDGAVPKATGRIAIRGLVARPVEEPGAGTVSVTLAPQAHLVRYPVTAQDLNIVIITKGTQASARWSEPVSPSDVARLLAAFDPQYAGYAHENASWRQWPLVEAPQLKTYAQGRVVLIGDAAHAMMPFLAQGAVMAFEDAVVLADAIGQWSDDPATAFQAYSAARLVRTQRVVMAAQRNGRIYHLGGAAGRARDVTLAALPGSLIMRGYDWLYGGASDLPIK
jgi:salicylate hydroxylase